jgi:mRNA-degrading endonuclease RelE of RelBE toxin-antitoxin system
MGALRASDPYALAVVVAFLQEADSDEHLIDKFTTHGESAVGPFRVNVKGWVAARRRDDNLYRLRVLDTPATSYRVVYGYDWRKRRVGILAVVHKEEFDYGISSDLADRIQSDWRCATDGLAT